MSASESGAVAPWFATKAADQPDEHHYATLEEAVAAAQEARDRAAALPVCIYEGDDPWPLEVIR